jgi:Helix-turn-helix domain
MTPPPTQKFAGRARAETPAGEGHDGRRIGAQQLSTPGLALEFAEACRESRHGPNKLYDAIRDGLLKARKIGRKTVILRADLEAYLNALPALDLRDNPATPRCRNRNPVGRRKRVGEGASA